MNVTTDGEIDLTDVRSVEATGDQRRIGPGEILFNNTNSPALVGKTALVRSGPLRAFSNHMTRLVTSPDVAPGFLAYQLQHLFKSGYFRQLCKKHVNQASIATTTLLDSVPVLVPDRPEQDRIVAKLDALRARSRGAREALDAVPALLDRLRQSILAAAFRGDLTADWREANPDVEPASELLKRIRIERRKRWEEAELAKMVAKGKPPKDDRWKSKYVEPEPVDESDLPELPEGWCWASVEGVCDLQLGQQRSPEHAAAEVTLPYVRAANITWTGLDLSDVKEMGFPDPERYRLRVGDVLLSEASGSATEVGKPAIWRGEIPNCCYQKTLLRARPFESTMGSEWLHLCFLADAILGRFAAMAPGVGILHLTADRMSSWPVPMAPVDEQTRLVESVRSALATVAALEETAANLGASTAALDASALAKAFRGELLSPLSREEEAYSLGGADEAEVLAFVRRVIEEDGDIESGLVHSLHMVGAAGADKVEAERRRFFKERGMRVPRMKGGAQE
ncbi:MAG: hypothetical protein K1X94_01870 [Sandaracinaceae bacterium]|nr:hypothetical protein [Sandaracinaceae bacterium]